MSEQASAPIARDPAGRFIPGQSGNPRGKAPGTRNRAIPLRELMEEGEDRDIVRLVLDKAKGGDAVAARFVVGHLCPRPRSRSVEIELADGLPAHNVVAAHDAVLRALFAGEIAPDEAEAVTRVLDARSRAIAAWQQESIAMAYQPDFPALRPRTGVVEEETEEWEDEGEEGADPAHVLRQAQDEGSVTSPDSNAGQPTHDSDPPNRPAQPGDHLHSACIRQDMQATTLERQEAAPARLASLAGRAPPQAAAAFAGAEDSA
jgi:hypothetical protein